MADGIVNIRGKEYHTVAKRVNDFRQQHPDFALTTEIVMRDEDCTVMKAIIANASGMIIATGHAEEYRKSSQINRTSALENAETSAIGRALAAFGIGGTEFASANEVQNAIHQQDNPAKDYVFPEGPAKNITDLKGMARAVWREIEGCGDASELEPLLATAENKALFKQMEELENPSHRTLWEGDGRDNPGVKGLIERKKKLFDMNAISGGKYEGE